MRLSPAQAAARLLTLVESGVEAALVVRLDGMHPLRRLVWLQPGAHPGPATLQTVGSLGTGALDTLADDLGAAVLAGLAPEGERALGEAEVYVEVHRARPRLLIVGAGHIARPLADVGALLGFRVVVLDDRPDFATQERFPSAHEVVRVDFAEPFAQVPVGGADHVVLVTRGHKYDYECLRRLLVAPVAPRYVGMIGSRRRVRATFHQLLEEGIPRERVEAVRAPLGLDLGAETPAEIAVAIAAEIVESWRGGTCLPLSRTERVLDRFFPDDAHPSPR